jgi:hypothetical protein
MAAKCIAKKHKKGRQSQKKRQKKNKTMQNPEKDHLLRQRKKRFFTMKPRKKEPRINEKSPKKCVSKAQKKKH